MEFRRVYQQDERTLPFNSPLAAVWIWLDLNPFDHLEGALSYAKIGHRIGKNDDQCRQKKKNLKRKHRGNTA